MKARGGRGWAEAVALPIAVGHLGMEEALRISVSHPRLLPLASSAAGAGVEARSYSDSRWHVASPEEEEHWSAQICRRLQWGAVLSI